MLLSSEERSSSSCGVLVILQHYWYYIKHIINDNVVSTIATFHIPQHLLEQGANRHLFLHSCGHSSCSCCCLCEDLFLFIYRTKNEPKRLIFDPSMCMLRMDIGPTTCFHLISAINVSHAIISATAPFVVYCTHTTEGTDRQTDRPTRSKIRGVVVGSSIFFFPLFYLHSVSPLLSVPPIFENSGLFESAGSS